MAEYKLTKLGEDLLTVAGVGSVGMLLMCVRQAGIESKHPTVAKIVECTKAMSWYRLGGESAQLDMHLMVGGLLSDTALTWAVEKGYIVCVMPVDS